MLTALLVLSWIAVLFPRILLEFSGQALTAAATDAGDMTTPWRTDPARPSSQPSGAWKRPARRASFPPPGSSSRALQFMVFLGLLGAGGAAWFAQFRQTTRPSSALAFTPELRPEDLTHIAWQLVWTALPAAGAGRRWRWPSATLGFRLITTRFGFSLKKLAPDLARLNPLSQAQGVAAPEPAQRCCSR